MAADLAKDTIFGSFKSLKIEKEEFPDLCRVCMCKNKNMKSVFSPELSRTIEEIEFCTGILILEDDGLPTMLCDTCIANLSVAHKFKKTCLFADKKFRMIIGQQLLNECSKEKEEVKEKSDFQFDVPVVTKLEVAETNVINNQEKIQPKPPPKRKPVIKQKAKKPPKNVCDICGMEFRRKLLMIKHKSEIHQLKSKVGKGKTERKKMKPRPKMSFEEIINHRIEKKDPLCCNICKDSFHTQEILDKHKWDTHRYQGICEVCGMQFLYRSSLMAHVRSHMPPDIPCPHCDYITSFKADLKKHLMLHSGSKAHACPQCPSSFHNISNLYGHMRRLHGGKRSYGCPRCEKSFYGPDCLKRHLDTHDKIKRFECDVCHTQFTKRSHWKRHLLKQHSITVPLIKQSQRKSRYRRNL